MKKLSEMTDEERYGKVGAEIRRLDPEAYKNRKDKSAAANMKLLRELREKAKAPATGRSAAFEESRDVAPAPKETQADKDRRTPGSGAGFKNIAANLGDTATRDKYRARGYGRQDDDERKESMAERRSRIAREVAKTSGKGPRGRGSALKNMSRAERNIYDAGRSVRGFKKGGSIDGIAKRGKTRGKII